MSGGLIIAIVITVVLLVGGGIAALVLSGGSDKPKPVAAAKTAAPEPAKATATQPPKKADLARQVQTLDALMKTSHQGRQAAAKGDTKAAIANRAKLLKDVRRLRGQAADAQLKKGLGSFAAAVRESLRQNRECGAACSASDLRKVGRLKQETVDALNPLLRKYAKTTYRARDI
jgi:flagellar basal body-associated protein FliL